MKKILVVCMLVLMISPVVVFAQTTGTPAACRSVKGVSADAPQIGTCVSQIYLWAMGAAGILALLMMVVGGYHVITASGNAALATKGKSYLLSSIIGIVILLGAYLLLNTINPEY